MPTQQPIIFQVTDNATSTVIEYTKVNARDRPFLTTEANAYSIIPTDGNLKEFHVKIDTAPGAAASGNQYKFYFRVTRGGSPVDHAEIIINETDTSGSTTGLTVDLQPLDLVTIKYEPVSSPNTFGRMEGVWIFEPDTDDEYILLGSSPDTVSNSGTEYNALDAGSASCSWATTQDNRKEGFSEAGTLKKFAAALPSTPGAAPDHYDITVQSDNGGSFADTALTLELNDSDFDKVTTSETATIAAGDLVMVKSVPTDTPTALRLDWACVFTPTTSGRIPIIGWGNNNTVLSSGTTEYAFVGSGQNAGTPEATFQIETPIAFTFKSIYVELNSAPGATTSYNFIVRKDAADTALNALIQDTAVSNTESTDVSFSAGEKFNVSVVPNNTPGTPKCIAMSTTITYSPVATSNTANPFSFGAVNLLQGKLQ